MNRAFHAPPQARTIPWQWLLLALAIPALVILINDPGRGFTADDFWFAGSGNLEDDPSVCSLAESFTGDWHSGAQGAGGWLRPMSRITWWFNDQLFGIGFPLGYYLTNALLHSLNVIMAVLLFESLLGNRLDKESVRQGIRYASVAAGALFLFAPQAGSSVGWVSARTDLLASFFLLAVLLAAALPLSALLASSLVIPLTFLSIFSKESGYLTFPFLALWLVVRAIAGQGNWRRDAIIGVACLSATLLMAGWRIYWLGGRGGYDYQFHVGSLLAGLQWLLNYFAASLQWEAVPTVTLGGAILAVGAALLAWRPGYPWLLLAPAIFGLAILPVAAGPIFNLELIPVENDRFLYISAFAASFLFAGLAAPWLEAHPQSNRAALVLLCAMALFSAAEFTRRDAAWANASRIATRLGNAVIDFNRSYEEAGESTVIYEDMDYIGYEKTPLHALNGAKILPMHQTNWAVWRLSRGEVISYWGLEGPLLENPGLLTEIGYLGNGDFELRHYRMSAPETITYGDLPSSETLTLPFHEIDEPLAAILNFSLRQPNFHPFLKVDGKRFHSKDNSNGELATIHFPIGVNPQQKGEWRLIPQEFPGEPNLFDVRLHLFPLEILSVEKVTRD